MRLPLNHWSAATAAQRRQAAATLRLLTVALVVGLIALCLLWELHWAPGPAAKLWALKALPPCLALGGLLSHRLTTYRWMALWVWLYAAEGALQLAIGVGVVRWLGLAELLLALALFASSVLYIQLRLHSAPPTTR